MLLPIALIAYLLASVLIALRVRERRESNDSGSGFDSSFGLAFAAATAGAAAHSYYAISYGVIDGAINFSLSSMTIIVSAMLILVYLLACIAMPIKRLGILIFPLTTLSLGFSMIWASEAVFLSNSGAAFSAHVLISILAYSLLAIAAIQAILYVYQERQLKSRTMPAMLLALPPLQTMEQLLFRLVTAGFILLSFTLLSGAFFSQQIFGLPFEFKHHTILAIIGWLVFAVLLVKRYRQGLRGSQAVIWVVGGFLLIQLGYFGTKLISESLLG